MPWFNISKIIFILKVFYFEIIMDSQEVAKLLQRGPVDLSLSFPQWLHHA